MALMETGKKSRQLKAAASTDSADEMMRRMLSETEGPQETGRERALKGDSRTTVTSGRLLGAMLPAGPPLTLGPKEPSNVMGAPREEVIQRTQRIEQGTPEVKRVVVKGGDHVREPPREPGTHRTPPGAVRVVVSEHGTRDATGKGRGSGMEPPGLASRELIVNENPEKDQFGELRSNGLVK